MKVKGPSMMESLTNECLKNPYIWALAIIYFFVYTVRQGVTSWFIFYLLKVCQPLNVPCNTLACASHSHLSNFEGLS